MRGKCARGQRSPVIVVATADFEVYHEVVTALRERGVTFARGTVHGPAAAEHAVALALALLVAAVGASWILGGCLRPKIFSRVVWQLVQLGEKYSTVSPVCLLGSVQGGIWQRARSAALPAKAISQQQKSRAVLPCRGRWVQ